MEEVKRIAAGLRGEIGYTQAVLPLVLYGRGTQRWKSGEAIFGGRRAAEAKSRVSVWEYLGSSSGRAGDSSMMLGTERNGKLNAGLETT